MKKQTALLWTFLIKIGVLTSGQTTDDITSLHTMLLSGYSKHVPPVTDLSKPIMVNVTFDLISIKELDELSGKFSVTGVLWMRWEDPRIRWNPYAYNGITSTRISMQEVWKPDFVITHNMEPAKAIGYDHYWYPVRYIYNGSALWAPSDLMSSTCYVDITYYPFDSHKCELIFLPWGSMANEMILNGDETVSKGFFRPNGEWSLYRATSRIGLEAGLYPSYNVLLELTRRPRFVVVNIILPILLMGFLNVLVFFLPPCSGERISFAITVLLATAVFLTLVGDNLPKTSEPMPIICYFLLTNLILSSAIMCITVLNLNLYHRDTNLPVPHWLEMFVRLFRCKTCVKSKIQPDPECDNDVSNDQKTKETTCLNKTLPSKAITLDKPVTWRGVSEIVDKLFFFVSLLWLLFSVMIFFIVVLSKRML